MRWEHPPEDLVDSHRERPPLLACTDDPAELAAGKCRDAARDTSWIKPAITRRSTRYSGVVRHAQSARPRAHILFAPLLTIIDTRHGPRDAEDIPRIYV